MGPLCPDPRPGRTGPGWVMSPARQRAVTNRRRRPATVHLGPDVDTSDPCAFSRTGPSWCTPCSRSFLRSRASRILALRSSFACDSVMPPPSHAQPRTGAPAAGTARRCQPVGDGTFGLGVPVLLGFGVDVGVAVGVGVPVGVGQSGVDAGGSSACAMIIEWSVDLRILGPRLATYPVKVVSG